MQDENIDNAMYCIDPEEAETTDERNEKGTLVLRDTPFVDMMKRRIFNVLLIANPYDAFMLEDDGRVDEKILRNTPNSVCAILLVSSRWLRRRKLRRN